MALGTRAKMQITYAIYDANHAGYVQGERAGRKLAIADLVSMLKNIDESDAKSKRIQEAMDFKCDIAIKDLIAKLEKPLTRKVKK